MTNELIALRDRLRDFTHEREWHRYHTPKNLAMALIVEAAELAEHFQWLTPSIEAEQCVNIKQVHRLYRGFGGSVMRLSSY